MQKILILTNFSVFSKNYLLEKKWYRHLVVRYKINSETFLNIHDSKEASYL